MKVSYFIECWNSLGKIIRNSISNLNIKESRDLKSIKYNY